MGSFSFVTQFVFLTFILTKVRACWFYCLMSITSSSHWLILYDVRVSLLSAEKKKTCLTCFSLCRTVGPICQDPWSLDLRHLRWTTKAFPLQHSSQKPMRPSTLTWAATCTPAAWPPSPNTLNQGNSKMEKSRSEVHVFDDLTVSPLTSIAAWPGQGRGKDTKAPCGPPCSWGSPQTCCKSSVCQGLTHSLVEDM